MARYKGHEGELSIGGSTVGEVESFEISISGEELGANVMGTGWTDAEGGQQTATLSINVLTDPADAGQAALTVNSTVAATLYPIGNTTGLTQITGNFLVTEKGRSTQVGSLVKTTYQLRNKGAITEGVVA